MGTLVGIARGNGKRMIIGGDIRGWMSGVQPQSCEAGRYSTRIHQYCLLSPLQRNISKSFHLKEQSRNETGVSG